MSIDSWFSTNVYYESLQKSGLKNFNKELLEECYQIRDYDEEGREWSKDRYVGGYTSYSSMNNLHQFSSTFMDLEEKIGKHVASFTDHLEMDLRGCAVFMTDCWVNIMPSRISHGLHIHPLSFLSGTYYVQTPGDCGGIRFEDPRLTNMMAAPPRKSRCSKANKQFANYKAKAGKLVLFESWLRHEVPAALNSEDRVSISFNYAWN